MINILRCAINVISKARKIRDDMIFKGFKFGMLLQLAIGPMCLMVFNTSAAHGFFTGLVLVIAIAVIDAIYIMLSGLGVAAIMNKKNVRVVIKILGCIILVLFGVNAIFSTMQVSFLPEIHIFSHSSNGNIFIQGLLLTASNPLTIIFWSGVFSTQVVENDLSKRQLISFGFGCVMSTLIFLTLISLGGSILNGFLPSSVIHVLNDLVGVVLIFFGIRLLFKK